MKRVLAGLLGLLVAWLALANASAAAAEPPPRACPVYDHNSQLVCALSADSATERGPPAAHDPYIAYNAVDRWSHGAAARPDRPTPSSIITYDLPARHVQSAGVVTTALEATPDFSGLLSSFQRSDVAANGGEKLLWTSWQNYPKVTQGGREYAQIGDRLYTHHAVDRLQPSGLGAPAGAIGAGRSISPNFVEDVLSSTKGVPTKGPQGQPRLSFVSGSVEVITENNIVVTVITR